MTPEESKISLYRRDPVAFVREKMGVEPDNWQAEVLRAFPTNQRIAMKACKGPGKTTVLAWLGWNFLCTRPYPKVAATSITSDNLNDGLWTEMAKWQNKSPLLREKFLWTKTRIVSRDHPENWFMSARTWPKSADTNRQADTLAGLHADYLLFLIDESGGIPDAVMVAAEAGLATGIETKIVQAGNPTHLEGPLYRACVADRSMWYVVEITGDPDSTDRATRIDVNWARQQIKTYGKDNPWVLVNVFGQFPPSSINTLLGPDEIRDSMKRTVTADVIQHAQRRLGIDVARFGDDRSVLFPRQGLVAFKPVELRNMRTTDIAARAAHAILKWKAEIQFIDDTGHWGHGVIDNLITAGFNPQGIQFHGKPIDPRYKNKRVEMWFMMAEWVKRGGCLPNISELVGELATPTYTFSNGKVCLEDKDQIKQRLGRSPDLADALALTFALPDVPAGTHIPFGRNHDNTILHEWDPFDESRR